MNKKSNWKFIASQKRIGIVLIALLFVYSSLHNGLIYGNNSDSNRPPFTPIIPVGPTSGITNVTLTYIDEAGDPDGDRIQLWFDWGNGNYSNWSDLKASWSTFQDNYSWINPGIYEIRAQARDEWGMESEWSQPLEVTITIFNMPPGTPETPIGSKTGYVGVKYLYSTMSSDPDNNQIKYGWDFHGNNIVDEWSEWYDSFKICSIEYSWSYVGTYQIKVKAMDIHGAESEWSTPLLVSIDANHPPEIPSRPTGPTSGNTGNTYTYRSITADPEGNKIYYLFDWGDGNNSGWIGPFESGETGEASYIWKEDGNYEIKVKARDDWGLESEWSEHLTITMPKSYHYPFNLSQISNLFSIITRLLFTYK